jgi:hypothetical protein
MSVNGSNNFLNIEDANLRVRNGSVHAQGMTIGGAIVSASHGLQSVSDTGNTTSNTLQFTNATTAFKATSNIELTSASKIIVESNVLMDFKTLGQIEFPGPLTLGQSLDVPRISRYDVDTETPRPEKLVVDFDTTVNSSPTDISGKGNHGTLVGATYSAADKAFSFDGGDYIQGSLTNSSNFTNTVSLWFKMDEQQSTLGSPGTTGNRRTIFEFGDIGNRSGLNHGGIDIRDTYMTIYMGDTGELPSSAFAPQQNQWHHLVLIYSGSGTLRIFIDNTEYTSSLVSVVNGTLAVQVNADLLLGSEGRLNAAKFRGDISNFKVYSVALEPSEVKKLYNLGRTGRSMVISDTAVGIGKVPEAQLDVRGNLNVDGVITNQQRPAFYVWRDGTGNNVEAIGHGGQSRLAVTGVITNWDSKRIDTAGTFDLNNGRYYIPVSGLYMLIGAGVYRYQSGNAILEASFYVNGSNVGPRGISYNRGNTANEHHTVTITFMRFMNAGDYVQMGVPVAQSACDLYYGGNLGYFSGYLLG